MADAGETSSVPSSDQSGGLYSGFERYTTPTDADYSAVMQGGLVVLDTNTLLHLYRYTAQVRTVLLNVIARVGNQLWEPNQVMLEFWRRRESAIRDYRKAADEFNNRVSTAQAETIKAIGTLGNRIGLDAEHKEPLAQPIKKAFEELSSQIAEIMKAGGASELGRNTNIDPVLTALEPILRGRVGGSLDSDSYQAATAEAKRRKTAKEPPGYKDPDDGYGEGDYLVWTQIIKEATARRCDVLFVTGDVKEDWWRKWGNESSAGPRLELLDEFHAKVGRRLFMLQPADFLAKAATVLRVAVAEESVAQARRIDQYQRQGVSSPAAEYALEVTNAIGRVADQQGWDATTMHLDGPIDYEIRSEEKLIGVIVKYLSRPLSMSSIFNYVRRAANEGYSRVLIISHDRIKITESDLKLPTKAHAVYVQWRNKIDDESLSSGISELFG